MSTTADWTPAATTWNAGALAAIRDQPYAPRLFTNATVRTLDPIIGDMTGADVLLGGELIVGVGPGIINAAGDDGAIVIDCTGLTIVPAVIDTLALSKRRRSRDEQVATLVPGNRADLAILEDRLAPSAAAAAETLARGLENTATLVVAGEVVRWDGRDLDAQRPGDGVDALAEPSAEDPRLGMWIDESDFLHQELTADGRYDETRGGRPHAFGGRFWISGDRIDYLDNLGFWAFGQFDGDELHHAGYILRRRWGG